MKQSTWELWFVPSIIAWLAIFFVMTLENSREIKELPYIALVLTVNVIASIIYAYRTEPLNNTDDDQ